MVFKRLKLHQFLMVQQTLVSARSLMSGIAAQITLNRTHLVCGGTMRLQDTRITNFHSRGNDVRRREMLNKL